QKQEPDVEIIIPKHQYILWDLSFNFKFMEMKKFIYILPYTLLLIACHHDLLETVPTDRLSQSIFWQTETDAIYGSNSVYRYLDGLMVKYDGLTDVLHANVQFSDAASLERGDF